MSIRSLVARMITKASSPESNSRKRNRDLTKTADEYAQCVHQACTVLLLRKISSEDLVNPFRSELLHFDNSGFEFSFHGFL